MNCAALSAKIIAFTVGAGAGVVLSKVFRYHGLLVVAGLLVVTACLSFVRSPAGWRLPGLVKNKREAEVVAG